MLELHFNKDAGHKTWNFIKSRLQHRYFLTNFAHFSKIIMYRTPSHDCSCWFLHSNQSFIHWFFFYFHFLLDFFPFIIDNCNYESFVRKGLKIKIFFTIIIQKLTGMLQRQFHRRNNLPMLNFEGCIICTILKT